MTTIAIDKNAAQQGYDDGWAVGHTVINARTTEAEARRILDGYDRGDADILGMCRTPNRHYIEASLEYAGTHYDAHTSADYETAYFDGYWNEVLKNARARHWSHVIQARSTSDPWSAFAADVSRGLTARSQEQDFVNQLRAIVEPVMA